MPEKVLILGGTKEAAELAAALVAAGHDVTTSLAGRTREPEPVAGRLRRGGFGGATGLAAFLGENGFDRVIDVTHPFARQISSNAVEASKISGVPLEIRTRPQWARETEDNWIEVDTLEAARDAIPPGARVLLALGSQHIAPFGKRHDVHFVVRMVDPPLEPLPLASHEIVTGKPGRSAGEECELFARYAITHLVCRNSGGGGAYAKIEAARMMGLPVIILTRPKR